MTRRSGKCRPSPVQGFRHSTLPQDDGEEADFTLAKVDLDNGKTIVISLGERSKVQALELEKGDRVEILGATGRIAGQQVIVAREVRANDNAVRVNGRVARLADQEQQREYAASREDR